MDYEVPLYSFNSRKTGFCQWLMPVHTLVGVMEVKQKFKSLLSNKGITPCAECTASARPRPSEGWTQHRTEQFWWFPAAFISIYFTEWRRQDKESCVSEHGIKVRRAVFAQSSVFNLSCCSASEQHISPGAQSNIKQRLCYMECSQAKLLQ